MEEFKPGDVVVHLGGALKERSRNRGRVLTILEGPVRIDGYSGNRYIVDKPIWVRDAGNATVYHANAEYLLKL